MNSHKTTDWGAFGRIEKVLKEHEFMFETFKEIYGVETFSQVERKLSGVKEIELYVNETLSHLADQGFFREKNYSSKKPIRSNPFHAN